MYNPENREEIVLVNGQFDAGDAQELLCGLINYKVRFHQLKCFSSSIRTGNGNKNSSERIVELEDSLVAVHKLIEKAREEGMELEIHSDIKIQLKKGEPEAVA